MSDQVPGAHIQVVLNTMFYLEMPHEILLVVEQRWGREPQVGGLQLKQGNLRYKFKKLSSVALSSWTEGS